MTGLRGEVIAIGDEMTSGAKLDTNSPWLCRQLQQLGIAIHYQTLVGDVLEDNVRLFRAAAERSDVVVASGGLGPTADDLTRQALAAAAGVPLRLNPAALARIEALFAARARPMPPRNRVQAELPQGAIEVINPEGTAPGIDLTLRRPDGGACRLFALPGVPAEMKQMYCDTVAPRIVQFAGGRLRRRRGAVVKCFGIGESDMEALLGDMIARDRQPRVGITVSAATISLRISAEADSDACCDQLIAATRAEILARAGRYVFGEGDEFELHHALLAELAHGGQRLATIEGGAGCPLASWLADAQPHGVYLGGDVISGPVDDPDGRVRRWTGAGADWVIVVDGYPRREPGPPDAIAAAPSQVRFIVVGPGGRRLIDQTDRITGHPAILHPRIAKTALSLARVSLKTGQAAAQRFR